MEDRFRLVHPHDRGKLIYDFRRWRPGSHSCGAPSVQMLGTSLSGKNSGRSVARPDREGFEKNTSEELRPIRERYKQTITFGQDVQSDGAEFRSVGRDAPGQWA